MENDIYEITTKTCALIAKDKTTTEIIEEDKTFIVNKPISKVLNESCEYYGSTLEGRIKGSKTVLGMCYKLPIIIESSNEIIFFPTLSPYNENCSWISIQNIKDYTPIDNNVIIRFKGDVQEMFPITYECLENQLFRATKLMLLLRSRKNAQIS